MYWSWRRRASNFVFPCVHHRVAQPLGKIDRCELLRGELDQLGPEVLQLVHLLLALRLARDLVGHRKSGAAAS